MVSVSNYQYIINCNKLNNEFQLFLTERNNYIAHFIFV